ncbi:mCG1039125 [Mus musculus]|nr:mCG1039125 [Mus musculus]
MQPNSKDILASKSNGVKDSSWKWRESLLST